MAVNGGVVRQVSALVVGTVVLALTGFMSPALGVPAEEASRAAPAAAAGGIDWQPCGPDFPGFDCATMAVPLDHDDPGHGSTYLALARLPAADQENRIGSVFVNPGGPGGSGVNMVLGGFGEFLGSQLEGRFDVVGFDPRGVAASDPLHCFDSEEDLIDFWSGQPVFPYLKHQYRSFFKAISGLADECQDGEERIAWHMSTADVARDLDRLRKAVGDRRLTYLGFSYGSYLGTTYANLFPDNVRALAIDGVLDPRLWSSGRQITSDRIATQEEFEEFLRLCDEAAEDCAFWTPEGSAERWDRLAATVLADPVELPDFGLYTYDYLIADALSAMYAPEVWSDAAAFFDLLADPALTGEGAAAAVESGRLALLEGLGAGTEEADYPNGSDAFYGNHCADADYPDRFARWMATDRYARRGSQFGPLWWWSNTGCAHWEVNEDRYTGPWTARTSAPVLVVGNYFDGVTDHRGAVATDRLLRHSRLLSYAGWGHTAYGRSQCATDYIDDYLLTGSLPPRGEVCPANPNPFLPQAARLAEAPPLVGLPMPWLLQTERPGGSR